MSDRYSTQRIMDGRPDALVSVPDAIDEAHARFCLRVHEASHVVVLRAKGVPTEFVSVWDDLEGAGGKTRPGYGHQRDNMGGDFRKRPPHERRAFQICLPAGVVGEQLYLERERGIRQEVSPHQLTDWSTFHAIVNLRLPFTIATWDEAEDEAAEILDENWGDVLELAHDIAESDGFLEGRKVNPGGAGRVRAEAEGIAP